MSILRKTPFINSVVSSLSAEQLQTLKQKLSLPTIERHFSLINGFTDTLTSANLGIICTCSIRLSISKISQGILIFSDLDKIAFIGYTTGEASKVDILPLVKLDLTTRKYISVDEFLTADELRNVIDDTIDGSSSSEVTADQIDSGEAPLGKILTANGEGGASWEDPSATGLPEAGGANEVLVSGASRDPEWKDSAPLSDNLKTTAGVTNDTIYSAGSTGGLADISNDNVGYLQEIKGFTIVWNQLLDAEHTEVTLKSGHFYAKFTSSGAEIVEGDGETTVTYVNEFSRLYDLSLMFSYEIPFNIYNDSETEYPANGTLPAQVVTPIQQIMRLFADIDLYHEPYNAGEFKSVSCNKITEVGRNLWNKNDADMVENGLLLLPGYRYEIYTRSDEANTIRTKLRGTNAWGQTVLTRATRTDGKYIWYYAPSEPTYVKAISEEEGYQFVYVGFVHSGNNCLTTTNGSYNYTDVEIPEYTKKEYPISGISGLRGLYYTDINVCDTVDFTRVGEVDLDEIADQITFDEDMGDWVIPISALPHFKGEDSLSAVLGNDPRWLQDDGFKRDEETDEILGIYVFLDGSSEKPTGKMLYCMEPQPTGSPAFAPITLEVDDMGFEYFSGMTYAPVNQKTFYGINLKDKLVNLQDGTKVESVLANFNNGSGYETLYAIKIGDTSYNIIPYNYNKSNNFLSVGNPSAQITGYATVIGESASTNWLATNSITIGQSSKNALMGSVCFDGSTSNSTRYIQLQDTSKIFFRNENANTTKRLISEYTGGHFLDEYITLQNLAGSNQLSNDTFISTKTFNDGVVTGVHLVIRIEATETYYEPDPEDEEAEDIEMTESYSFGCSLDVLTTSEEIDTPTVKVISETGEDYYQTITEAKIIARYDNTDGKVVVEANVEPNYGGTVEYNFNVKYHIY